MSDFMRGIHIGCFILQSICAGIFLAAGDGLFFLWATGWAAFSGVMLIRSLDKSA